MTKEDKKELLLKDLSCRIPYGVFVKIDGMSKIVKLTSVSYYGEVGIDDSSTYLYPISEVKPYLFPLSSMTDEEWEDYQKIRMIDWIHGDINGTFINASLIVDWLNAHHFDYRGLIPMDLAIDATGFNIY